jgi:molybdate transport system regulatory protein
MKTTARNQFAGTVSAVLEGPATTQVTLDIGGGLAITAAITTEAARQIGAEVGADALALVKASEVVLVTDFAGWRLSARNQLAGNIARIQKGATTSLVGLTLAGGATITSSVTNDAVDALGLAIGQPATAVFKAPAVMLAIAASDRRMNQPPGPTRPLGDPARRRRAQAASPAPPSSISAQLPGSGIGA